MKNTSKVWFITGASSGFGRSITEQALARGERVVATARKPEALASRYGADQLLTLRLDVTQASEARTAIRAAIDHFGAIDVLVNNAGYSIVGALEETPEEILRETMELMFFSAVNLTRELIPHMRERRTGTIVQITSMGGITTGPGWGAYCAAKHALEGLSECLAAEVAPFGVRVLIVEPGAFRTALFGTAFRRMPQLPEYSMTVGTIREFVSSVHGAQAGDPDKAARAIIDAVNAGAPTLRLPLGPDAVQGIRDKLAGVLADVAKNEATALASVYDPS